jgi:hypothetical protein
MRKRILSVTAATSLAVGTLAGSALAHHNDAAGKLVGPPSDAPGWLVGHMGMECGAILNPQTPLDSLGVELGLACPAAVAPVP